MINCVVIGAKGLLPKVDISIAGDSAGTPDNWFIANIMITGYQIKGVAQINNLLVKTLGGHFITIPNCGHWMHYIAEVDYKLQIATIKVLDHMPQSAVGALVDFKLGVALRFTKIDVGIRDYRVRKLIFA